jgi:hydroxypyruvate reductase
VVAAGKAAAAMASAFVRSRGLDVRGAVAIGTHASSDLDSAVHWMLSSHPFPDERSVAAAETALAMAAAVGRDETLVLLLSGGASALMAAPVDGVTLQDKVEAARRMMEAGADIEALNTVRKHLSRVKGGRLAAACAGRTLTLAISDVVGDDLSVIGSGPGVADPSTWADAGRALDRFGAGSSAVRAMVARGANGAAPETPKPGDAALARVSAHVIGRRADALAGALAAAERLGYRATVMPGAVTGEARITAPEWLARAAELLAGAGRPVCLLSGGETTVRVRGSGRGGRNQEFALALARPITTIAGPAVAASAGTDGIDGSTDAAGAMVDSTTVARAAALGLGDLERYLDHNDSGAFFQALGDSIRTGPTDTNVGDLQILLLG